MSNLVQFHNQIFFELHSLIGVSPQLNKLILIFAEKIDVWLILFAVMFGLVYIHNSKQIISEGLRVCVSVFFAWLISFLLKKILLLPRPFLRFPEITPLFEYGGFDSFPSGHATLFMALAIIVYLDHRNIGYLFIIMAILISIARVIAGVHFPIDIIAGWILGGGVAFFVSVFLKKVKRTWSL